jgi:hypothetical protein
MTNYNYEMQRQTLIDYLQLMVSRADWHGVSDAANDLRVLEAENRNPDLAQVGEVGIWTADDTAYRPGGMPQSETSICCQDFEHCNRSCTPRGQWLAQKEAQREWEWQGLTDEERTFLAWESNNETECVAMTEAKLKEKNT